MASHDQEDLQEQEPIPVEPPTPNQLDVQSPSYDGPEPSVAESTDLHLRDSDSASGPEDFGLPVPVWLRESSKTFYWKWVPLPVRTFARFLNRWSKGPDPSQIQNITPFFPKVQEAPLWLVEKFLPRMIYKASALLLIFCAWVLTFILIIRHSAASGHIEGYGTPQAIWCGANLWSVTNQALFRYLCADDPI